jgi:hypothetical protein
VTPVRSGGGGGSIGLIESDSICSFLVWVPRFRGWRRGSLNRGDGEEFLVHGEKREGIGKLLEMVSSPI